MKNPHGGATNEEILDFSVSTNPLGTPPGALAAARAALDRADRYPDPCCGKLTEAIAAYEAVPPEAVLCGNGAAELIFAYCAAVKPRRAAELAPCFSEYSAAAAVQGCAVERVPLAPEKGFLPDGGLEAYLDRARPELLFLCSPNNPTGRLLPPERAAALARFCAERGIRLFLDECFLELADGESLKGLLAEEPGLFLLKAFTKTWGMAGLRLGYGLSADRELLRRMAALTPPWNVSSVAQAAGIAALEERDFLRRTRALIARERPALRAGLQALGLWVCPSEANFLLFRGPETLGAALRERGVVLRDCGNFPGLGPGWYRTAVRTAAENARLLSALREVI